MTIMRDLIQLGLSPKLKGFTVLSQVLAVVKKADKTDVKKAYKAACSMQEDSFRNSDTVMRRALKSAWDRPRSPIRDMFPFLDRPPTPIEFVLVYSVTHFE